MSDSSGELTEPPQASVVSVTTGARLHFGLLRAVTPFGGLGVMIQSPATRVTVEPAPLFEVALGEHLDHDTVERVRQIAQRVATHFRWQKLPATRVTIQDRPDAHFGLGSGTQLSLAVAESILRSYSREIPPESIARDIAGRGERSAVGIHGYFHGGLIFEDAADGVSNINPIQSRLAIPDSWRVVLFRPHQHVATVSGECEREHFVRVETRPQHSFRRLTAIVTDDLVPAVTRGDFASFADAVQRFNHASGMLFEGVQGGPYNGDEITRLVESLTDLGAVGVGQSSWGPSVFSWFASEAEANSFIARLDPDFTDAVMTRAQNAPRQIDIAKPV